MNNLEVLYEDNSVIVVKKHANILSQSDNTKDIDMLTIVKQYVKEKYNKPGNVYIGLVHRLDRPVSGIMVFARNSKSASRLSEQIRTNKVKKKYVAVVDGIITKESGVYKDYLTRTNKANTEVTNSKIGKYSELEYKVLKINKEYKKTLVEIKLITGRHHQIRVQFASRNTPLCGDQRYGKQDKTQIALCAYYLEFVHPISKEKMQFELPIPKGENWKYFE